MKIYTNANLSQKHRNGVIAIGNFDGLHLGHQKVIREAKKEQLKKFKLDFLIIIKFNKQFSSLTAEEFIGKIIHKKTNSRYLFVSKNFKFGFKRRGSVSTLKKFEKIFNYTNVITKPFKKRGKIISSTLIRKKIRAGRIDIVNKLLNRNWCIRGKVIKGKKEVAKSVSRHVILI